MSDARDGFVECPSYEDDSYGLLKKELDKGIQVSKDYNLMCFPAAAD